MVEFLSIASAEEVNIYSPVRSFVSFTNSPYYSHEHGLAVDIYPFSAETTAFSPVRGDIISVFKVRSPRPEYFQADEEERLLIIQPTENPRLRVRILHTDYNSNSGTKLSVGTPIGSMIRSGFFNFWTERHIHVEVRDTRHLLRAKGSLPMLPSTHDSRLLGIPSEIPPKLRIDHANQNYIVADPIKDGTMTLGPITGFGCMIGETPGILDAGIPHYRLGSVHLERGVTISTGEKVSLWGTNIGKVMEYHKGLAIFESLPTEIRLNKHIIRGLSFHLWVGMHPLIMLIPQKPVNFSWCRKDEMLIHMRRTDSS